MKIKEAIEVLRRMNPNDEVELRFNSDQRTVVSSSGRSSAASSDRRAQISSSQFNDYYDDGPHQR